MLRTIRNKQRHFGHAWFAVRNLSSEERDLDSTLGHRAFLEDSFFSREQRSIVKRHRAGGLALADHLKSRINAMLQDNIEVLTTKTSTPTHSMAHSIIGSGTGETAERVPQTSLSDTETVEPPITRGSESVVTDADLEVASDAPRPTPLLNAITVALTVAVCLSLIGLGCRALALELASDGNWTRLLLLVTAVPQIVLSLVRTARKRRTTCQY